MDDPFYLLHPLLYPSLKVPIHYILVPFNNGNILDPRSLKFCLIT